jgi:PilZ domain
MTATASPARRRSALSASVRRRLQLAVGDRRLTRRYPITTELEYRIVGRDGLAYRGSGRTVNLSTGGILFQSEQALTPGMRIELTIAWPARLNDAVDLNLCVSGRVARTDGKSHVVRIREHEFCVRGKFRLPGPRFRVIEPVYTRAAAG